MAEEYLATAIQNYKFNKTNPIFGTVLAQNQVTGQKASLLIANPLGDQSINSGNLLFTNTSSIGLGVASPNARLEVTDTKSQFAFGNATDQGFLDGSSTGARIGFGARNNGTNFLARQTTFSGLFAEGSILKFMGNSGLTIGSTFTPTEYARFIAGRLLINTTTDNGVDTIQANGTISALTPTGLGTAASEGKLVPLDSSGQLPTSVIPSSGTLQGNFIDYTPLTTLGVADGVNTIFQLPVNDGVELIFVDSIPQDSTTYTRAGALITFVSGSVPIAGALIRAVVFDALTMTALTLLGTGNGTTVAYTLPGAGSNAVVWVHGVFQEPGVAYTLSGGVITFTTAPLTGYKVHAIAAVVNATNPLTTPVSIGTGDGSTTTYTLPGSAKGELVLVGGVLQSRLTNYAWNPVLKKITFTTAPASGVHIFASVASNPPSDIQLTKDAIEYGLGFPTTSLSYLAQNINTTTELTFGYFGGLLKKDNTITSVGMGSILLSANSTNYIYGDPINSPYVFYNTTGFVSGMVPLFVVVTNSTNIIGIPQDVRKAIETVTMDNVTPTTRNVIQSAKRDLTAEGRAKFLALTPVATLVTNYVDVMPSLTNNVTRGLNNSTQARAISNNHLAITNSYRTYYWLNFNELSYYDTTYIQYDYVAGNAFGGSYLADPNYGTTTYSWESAESGTGVNGVSWVGQDSGVGNTTTVQTITYTNSATVGNNLTSVLFQTWDGTTWTTTDTISLVTTASTIQTITLGAPRTSRGWRLLANSSPTGNWEVVEMTTATGAPDWTISASGTATAGTEYQAFDGTAASAAIWPSTTVFPAYIEAQAGTPFAATQYKVMSATTGAANAGPQAWSFQGSTDGTTWITLDSQSGQTAISTVNGGSAIYSISNTAVFGYYRLYITANGGNAQLILGELRIFNSMIENKTGSLVVDHLASSEPTLLSFSNGLTSTGTFACIPAQITTDQPGFYSGLTPNSVNYLFIKRDPATRTLSGLAGPFPQNISTTAPNININILGSTYPFIAIPIESAYWKFDETTGTSFSDSSGNTHTATGTTGFTTRGTNHAITFNGSEYLTTGWHPNPTTYTTCIWAYWNTTSGQQFLYGDYTTGNGYSAKVNLQTSGGGLAVVLSNGSVPENTYTSSFVPVAGVWTHVAVTVDNLFVRFYINGLLHDTIPQIKALDGNASSAQLCIGQSADTGFYSLNGAIDDFHIWQNQVLTQGQIQQVMTNPTTLTVANVTTVGRNFNNPVQVNTVVITQSSGANGANSVQPQWSNDGNNWSSIGSPIALDTTVASAQTITIPNYKAATYFRLSDITYVGQTGWSISNIVFQGSIAVRYFDPYQNKSFTYVNGTFITEQLVPVGECTVDINGNVLNVVDYTPLGRFNSGTVYNNNPGAWSSPLGFTSYTLNGYTISASTEAYPSWGAVSGNLNDYWQATNTTGTLTLKLPNPIAATSYFMVAVNDYGCSTAWTFQGSNDGSNWFNLHSVTGYSFPGSSGQTFNFTNSSTYSYYRLNFTGNTQGGYNLTVAKFQISTAANKNLPSVITVPHNVGHTNVITQVATTGDGINWTPLPYTSLSRLAVTFTTPVGVSSYKVEVMPIYS